MILQGSSLETLVKAVSGGSPVLGLDESDFTVKAWKAGLSDFDTIVLAAEDVVEVGDGYYALTLPTSVTSALGEIVLQFSSTSFDFVEKTFTVSPNTLSSISTPETCIVSGNIVDIGGQPGQGQQVVVRALAFPVSEGSSIVASDPITDKPNIAGNFAVILVRNQTVTIEIDRTGIKNQFVVPDQETAELLDLLPPF